MLVHKFETKDLMHLHLSPNGHFWKMSAQDNLYKQRSTSRKKNIGKNNAFYIFDHTFDETNLMPGEPQGCVITCFYGDLDDFDGMSDQHV